MNCESSSSDAAMCRDARADTSPALAKPHHILRHVNCIRPTETNRLTKWVFVIPLGPRERARPATTAPRIFPAINYQLPPRSTPHSAHDFRRRPGATARLGGLRGLARSSPAQGVARHGSLVVSSRKIEHKIPVGGTGPKQNRLRAGAGTDAKQLMI
jgi:hypothetical protein